MWPSSLRKKRKMTRSKPEPPRAEPADTAAHVGRGREIVSILARSHVERGVTPEGLRHILEELGPTFVKLGQILSMRTDILPAEYCAELEKLRVEAPPMPMEEVRAAFREALGKEIGEVCSRFDPEPVGSASIAQAHRAALLDGTDVVFKVQRRGARQVMAEDLALLRRAGVAVKLTGLDRTVDFSAVLDEMERVTAEEMDFRREADNLRTFAEQARAGDGLLCPQVYDAFSTDTLLCMAYVDGISPSGRQALQEAGYDPDQVGERLVEDYIRQVIDTGFFHADPHQGNVRVCPGNKPGEAFSLVWLDLGMMGRLSRRERELIARAVRAVTAHDVEGLRQVVTSLGKVTGRIDLPLLTADMDDFLLRYEAMDLGSLDLGAAAMELNEVARRNHIAMPGSLTMLARGLVTIEGVLRDLSPDTNVMEILTRYMARHALKDMDLKRDAWQFAQDLHGSFTKTARLPSQLSDVMRTFTKGESRLTVETRGDRGWSEDMARRLLMTLLACACVLGAALVCIAPELPRWAGLPVPAWLLGAAGAGLGAAALWRGRR